MTKEEGTRVHVARDWAAEIRALIEQFLAQENEYIAGIVAQKLVAKLRETDPDLLDGWLQAGAEDFMRKTIIARDSAMRTHNRTTANKMALGKAITAAETGDTGPLTEFLDSIYVGAGGTRKRLGNMTKDDLDYAADRYTIRAKQNQMAGAFLRALAAKVGNDQVRDHFTEGQLVQMWNSLSQN
jgi:hypothetical protein